MQQPEGIAEEARLLLCLLQPPGQLTLSLATPLLLRVIAVLMFTEAGEIPDPCRVPTHPFPTSHSLI